MSTPSSTPAPRAPGRRLVALGLGITVLGIIAYSVQIAVHRLFTPWYVPAAATLGVVLLLIALWQKRNVWRVLGLLLVVVIAGLAWVFVLARLPAYTGPVERGRPFPHFQTMRADGTPFTERDLEGELGSVLVFFRGRW
jgi:hypothetical protein